MAQVSLFPRSYLIHKNRHDNGINNWITEFNCDKYSKEGSEIADIICRPLWKANPLWAKKGKRILWIQASCLPEKLNQIEDKQHFDRETCQDWSKEISIT